MIGRYHVVPTSRRRWAVRRHGRRATRVFQGRAEAVRWAAERARSVVVHRSDGAIGRVRP